MVVPCTFPRSHTKSLIREYINQEWNKSWQLLPLARQTKIFFPTPDRRKAKGLLKASRELYSRAVRWITGHNFLRRHNNITDYVDTSKICRYCKSHEETSGHIITECEAFWQERRDSFSSYWLNPQSPNWTPEQLQAFLSATSVAWLEDDNSPLD